MRPWFTRHSNRLNSQTSYSPLISRERYAMSMCLWDQEPSLSSKSWQSTLSWSFSLQVYQSMQSRWWKSLIRESGVHTYYLENTARFITASLWKIWLNWVVTWKTSSSLTTLPVLTSSSLRMQCLFRVGMMTKTTQLCLTSYLCYRKWQLLRTLGHF